ncbi:MAG: type II toxin-antitoxin system ParD family antitoxin [Rhizobiaceae bacterium]|nr:type II toxin-antitoxin system ParD family antitoxin [Rhizobiaceae bacterium]MCV0406535.1 type II toxin-antitoxin system ParD family antitoxin [Rhizobiaceae bacterium]
MDETRKVSISDDSAAFLDEVVAAGEFGSGEAVVEEALREMRERRDNHGYTIAELRQLVEEGDRSGEGRFIDMEDLKAEARRRHEIRKSA